MTRPRAVSVALNMLWLGLVFASLEAAIAAAQRFGVLPFSGELRAGWSIGETFGVFGLVFQAVCIVSVARGYGWVRWPLLIGAGWLV